MAGRATPRRVVLACAAAIVVTTAPAACSTGPVGSGAPAPDPAVGWAADLCAVAAPLLAAAPPPPTPGSTGLDNNGMADAVKSWDLAVYAPAMATLDRWQAWERVPPPSDDLAVDKHEVESRVDGRQLAFRARTDYDLDGGMRDTPPLPPLPRDQAIALLQKDADPVAARDEREGTVTDISIAIREGPHLRRLASLAPGCEFAPRFGHY